MPERRKEHLTPNGSMCPLVEGLSTSDRLIGEHWAFGYSCSTSGLYKQGMTTPTTDTWRDKAAITHKISIADQLVLGYQGH